MILNHDARVAGDCSWQEGAEASMQDRRIPGPDHQVVPRRQRDQDQKRYSLVMASINQYYKT